MIFVFLFQIILYSKVLAPVHSICQPRDTDYSNYVSVFLSNEGDEDEIVNCSLMTVDRKKKIKLQMRNPFYFVMNMKKIEPKKWLD